MPSLPFLLPAGRNHGRCSWDPLADSGLGPSDRVLGRLVCRSDQLEKADPCGLPSHTWNTSAGFPEGCRAPRVGRHPGFSPPGRSATVWPWWHHPHPAGDTEDGRGSAISTAEKRRFTVAPNVQLVTTWLHLQRRKPEMCIVPGWTGVSLGKGF